MAAIVASERRRQYTGLGGEEGGVEGGGSGGVRVMIWGLGVPWPAELEGRSEWRQARRRLRVMGGEVGRDGAAGQTVEEP